MDLWAAFILGLVGSVHCAGMCGPLVLAVPPVGGPRRTEVSGRVIYHAGRLVSYVLLGIVFGMMGQALALGGIQRWVSIGAGLAILLGFFTSVRLAGSRPVYGVVRRMTSLFGTLLRQRTFLSRFILGVINGFLPCGLVYVACAGAVATGDLVGSVGVMLVFGLGTWPMMLGLNLAGRRITRLAGPAWRRLVPAFQILVALLLVTRGLSLGIPYISPDMDEGGCPSCHSELHSSK